MKKRWKKSDVALLTLVVLFVVGCEDDTGPVSPGVDPLYPTTIVPLSPADLTALTNELHSRFPRVCSDLDEYGNPVRRNGLCFSTKGVGVDPDAPTAPLVDAAKAKIAEMSDFTGVLDPEGLVVRRIDVSRPTEFSKGFLTIRFENQCYEGLEVLSTQVMAWADSLGLIGVTGRHFLSIHLPKKRISKIIAKQLLAGTEIRWWDAVMREHTYIVEIDSFIDDPVLVIHPLEVIDTIELRYVWQFKVGEGDFYNWHIYIDVITGEFLGTRQLFNT